MSPDEIQSALETLGLPPWISRDEIKARYRQLARSHHPDRSGDAERMEQINAAYAVLMEYIDTFRYRFDEVEIAQHYPERGHAEQFRF
jgi:DnaJ-class molecular chaperone